MRKERDVSEVIATIRSKILTAPYIAHLASNQRGGLARPSLLICLVWLLAAGSAGCRATDRIVESTGEPSSTPSVASSPGDQNQAVPEIAPTLMHPSPEPSPTPLFIRGDHLLERWLSGIPCEPPCWEGVRIGEMTAMEAREVLGENPLVAKVEGYRALSIELNTRVGFSLGPLRAEARFEDRADQVIYAVHTALPVATPLGRFIEVYGEPSHVIAFAEHDPHTGQPPHTWRVRVLWVSQGLAIVIGGGEPFPQIDESLEFDSISYYIPGLEGYAQAIGSPPQVALARPWHGYDTFEAYATKGP
jgi:hypothetical protein